MNEETPLDVNQENETPSEQSTENNDSTVSEDVKNTGEETKVEKVSPEDKANTLIQKDEKRILVDKDRFDDRNEKAKLAETFAPVIDKLKDDPDLVKQILGTKGKDSLEDRVAQMENERKDTKRRELTEAVTEAITKWSSFEKDWSDLEPQVEMLTKRGVGVKDAIRRSFLALHPEEAEAESKRMAQENANISGQFPSSTGHTPVVVNTTESPQLNEREQKVAKDLIGKSMDGWTGFKSAEEYATALEKNKEYLKAKGFYLLP